MCMKQLKQKTFEFHHTLTHNEITVRVPTWLTVRAKTASASIQSRISVSRQLRRLAKYVDPRTKQEITIPPEPTT